MPVVACHERACIKSCREFSENFKFLGLGGLNEFSVKNRPWHIVAHILLYTHINFKKKLSNQFFFIQVFRHFDILRYAPGSSGTHVNPITQGQKMLLVMWATYLVLGPSQTVACAPSYDGFSENFFPKGVR